MTIAPELSNTIITHSSSTQSGLDFSSYAERLKPFLTDAESVIEDFVSVSNPNEPIRDKHLKLKLIEAIVNPDNQAHFPDTCCTADAIEAISTYLSEGVTNLSSQDVNVIHDFLETLKDSELSARLGLSVEQLDTIGDCKACLPPQNQDQLEVARSVREQLRATAGISPGEQSFRDRAYLINPDDAQITFEVNRLYSEGVLTESMSEEELAEALLNYVNENFQYKNDTAATDGRSGDHWQSVRETLARGAGDCEDLSILQASLLSNVLKTKKGYSEKQVSEMVTLSAGYIDIGDGTKVGHTLVKFKPADSTDVYMLDPTSNQGLMNINDIEYEEVLEMNNHVFIKHDEITDDFVTSANLNLNFQIMLKNSRFGVRNGTAIGSHEAYMQNKDSLAWKINYEFSKLRELIAEPLEVPVSFNGALYKQLTGTDLNVNLPDDFDFGGESTGAVTEDDAVVQYAADLKALDDERSTILDVVQPGAGGMSGNDLQSAIERDQAALEVAISNRDTYISEYGDRPGDTALAALRNRVTTLETGVNQMNSLFQTVYGPHILDLDTRTAQLHQDFQDNYEPPPADSGIAYPTSYVRTVSRLEAENSGGTLYAGQRVAVESQADIDRIRAKIAVDEASLEEVGLEIEVLESQVARFPNNDTLATRLQTLKDRRLSISRGKTKLYEIINSPKDFKFFNVAVHNLKYNLQGMDFTGDLGKNPIDGKVQTVLLKGDAFYEYTLNVRQHSNRLTLLFHLANSIIETRLHAAREIHDMALTGAQADAAQKIRKTSDKILGKTAQMMNKFQSKVADGMEKISDELFSFVRSTNTSVFARKELDVDMWARSAANGGVGGFIGSFVAGAAAEFVDELSGGISFHRSKGKEEIHSLLFKTTAINNLEAARYMQLITKGKITSDGRQLGGLRLWSEDASTTNELYNEDRIHKEQYKNRASYFGGKIYKLMSEEDGAKDANERQNVDYSLAFVKQFQSSLASPLEYDAATGERTFVDSVQQNEFFVNELIQKSYNDRPDLGTVGGLYDVIRNYDYEMDVDSLNTSGLFHQAKGAKTGELKDASLNKPKGKDLPAFVSILKTVLGMDAAKDAITQPIKDTFNSGFDYSGLNGSPGMYLDYNMEKMVEFRHRQTRLQIAMFLALMTKVALLEKKVEAAKDISGAKGTSSTGAVMKVSEQALEAELGKQTKAFESFHQESIQLVSNTNKLIKTRAEYYKNLVKVPLKTTKSSAAAGVMIGAGTAASTLSGLVVSLAANPTNPVGYAIGQMLQGMGMGALPEPTSGYMYFNYLFTALGMGVLETITATIESGIEASVHEYQDHTTLFRDNQSSTDLAGVNRGTQGNRMKFGYQNTVDNIRDFREGAERAERGVRIFDKTLNIGKHDKGSLSNYYSNKLAELMYKPRLQYNSVLAGNTYTNGYNEYALDNVPGLNGSELQTVFGSAGTAGTANANHGASFIENKGNGYYAYNGLLGAHKAPKATHYRNLIKRHIMILKAIYDAIENEVAYMFGKQKPGGMSKFDGGNGFSVIDALLNNEAALVQDLKTEVNSFLLPGWNSNAQKDNTQSDLDFASAQALFSLTPGAMLAVLTHGTGELAQQGYNLGIDKIDESRKYIWGPYSGAYADYHKDNKIKDRENVVAKLDKAFASDPTHRETGVFHDGNPNSFRKKGEDVWDYVASQSNEDYYAAKGLTGFLSPNFLSGDRVSRENTTTQEFTRRANRLTPYYALDELEKNVMNTLYHGGKYLRRRSLTDIENQSHLTTEDKEVLQEFADANPNMESAYIALPSDDSYEFIGKASTGLEYEQVEYVSLIQGQTRLNRIATMRMMYMMLEQALYSQRQNVLRDMFGVSSSAGILQGTMTLIDNYNNAQFEVLGELTQEMLARVDAKNTHYQNIIDGSLEAAATAMMIPMVYNRYKAASDPTGSTTGKRPTSVMQSTVEVAGKVAIYKLIAKFIVGLIAILTAKPVPTMTAETASYDENNPEDATDTDKIGEIKGKKTEGQKKEDKLLRGDSSKAGQAQQSQQNQALSMGSGGMKFSSRGQFTANKAMLSRAKNQLKKKFRKIKLMRELAMQLQDAKLDAAADIGGTSQSGAHKGLMNIIGKVQSSEGRVLEHMFSAIKASADARNRGMEMIRAAVVEMISQKIANKSKSASKKAGAKQDNKKGKTSKPKGAIGRAMNSIMKFMSKLASPFQRAAGAVASVVKSFAKSTASVVKSVAKSIGGGIKSFFKKTGKVLGAVGSAIGGGIKTGAKFVGGKLADLGRWTGRQLSKPFVALAQRMPRTKAFFRSAKGMIDNKIALAKLKMKDSRKGSRATKTQTKTASGKVKTGGQGNKRPVEDNVKNKKTKNFYDTIGMLSPLLGALIFDGLIALAAAAGGEDEDDGTGGLDGGDAYAEGGADGVEDSDGLGDDVADTATLETNIIQAQVDEGNTALLQAILRDQIELNKSGAKVFNKIKAAAKKAYKKRGVKKAEEKFKQASKDAHEALERDDSAIGGMTSEEKKKLFYEGSKGLFHMIKLGASGKLGKMMTPQAQKNAAPEHKSVKKKRGYLWGATRGALLTVATGGLAGLYFANKGIKNLQKHLQTKHIEHSEKGGSRARSVGYSILRGGAAALDLINPAAYLKKGLSIFGGGKKDKTEADHAREKKDPLNFMKRMKPGFKKSALKVAVGIFNPMTYLKGAVIAGGSILKTAGSILKGTMSLPIFLIAQTGNLLNTVLGKVGLLNTATDKYGNVDRSGDVEQQARQGLGRSGKEFWRMMTGKGKDAFFLTKGIRQIGRIATGTSDTQKARNAARQQARERKEEIGVIKDRIADGTATKADRDRLESLDKMPGVGAAGRSAVGKALWGSVERNILYNPYSGKGERQSAAGDTEAVREMKTRMANARKKLESHDKQSLARRAANLKEGDTGDGLRMTMSQVDSIHAMGSRLEVAAEDLDALLEATDPSDVEARAKIQEKLDRIKSLSGRAKGMGRNAFSEDEFMDQMGAKTDAQKEHYRTLLDGMSSGSGSPLVKVKTGTGKVAYTQRAKRTERLLAGDKSLDKKLDKARENYKKKTGNDVTEGDMELFKQGVLSNFATQAAGRAITSEYKDLIQSVSEVGDDVTTYASSVVETASATGEDPQVAQQGAIAQLDDQMMQLQHALSAVQAGGGDQDAIEARIAELEARRLELEADFGDSLGITLEDQAYLQGIAGQTQASTNAIAAQLGQLSAVDTTGMSFDEKIEAIRADMIANGADEQQLEILETLAQQQGAVDEQFQVATDFVKEKGGDGATHVDNFIEWSRVNQEGQALTELGTANTEAAILDQLAVLEQQRSGLEINPSQPETATFEASPAAMPGLALQTKMLQIMMNMGDTAADTAAINARVSERTGLGSSKVGGSMAETTALFESDYRLMELARVTGQNDTGVTQGFISDRMDTHFMESLTDDSASADPEDRAEWQASLKQAYFKALYDNHIINREGRVKESFEMMDAADKNAMLDDIGIDLSVTQMGQGETYGDQFIDGGIAFFDAIKDDILNVDTIQHSRRNEKLKDLGFDKEGGKQEELEAIQAQRKLLAELETSLKGKDGDAAAQSLSTIQAHKTVLEQLESNTSESTKGATKQMVQLLQRDSMFYGKDDSHEDQYLGELELKRGTDMNSIVFDMLESLRDLDPTADRALAEGFVERVDNLHKSLGSMAETGNLDPLSTRIEILETEMQFATHLAREMDFGSTDHAARELLEVALKSDTGFESASHVLNRFQRDGDDYNDLSGALESAMLANAKTPEEKATATKLIRTAAQSDGVSEILGESSSIMGTNGSTISNMRAIHEGRGGWFRLTRSMFTESILPGRGLGSTSQASERRVLGNSDVMADMIKSTTLEDLRDEGSLDFLAKMTTKQKDALVDKLLDEYSKTGDRQAGLALQKLSKIGIRHSSNSSAVDKVDTLGSVALVDPSKLGAPLENQSITEQKDITSTALIPNPEDNDEFKLKDLQETLADEAFTGTQVLDEAAAARSQVAHHITEGLFAKDGSVSSDGLRQTVDVLDSIHNSAKQAGLGRTAIAQQKEQELLEDIARRLPAGHIQALTRHQGGSDAVRALVNAASRVESGDASVDQLSQRQREVIETRERVESFRIGIESAGSEFLEEEITDSAIDDMATQLTQALLLKDEALTEEVAELTVLLSRTKGVEAKKDFAETLGQKIQESQKGRITSMKIDMVEFAERLTDNKGTVEKDIQERLKSGYHTSGFAASLVQMSGLSVIQKHQTVNQMMTSSDTTKVEGVKEIMSEMAVSEPESAAVLVSSLDQIENIFGANSPEKTLQINHMQEIVQHTEKAVDAHKHSKVKLENLRNFFTQVSANTAQGLEDTGTPRSQITPNQVRRDLTLKEAQLKALKMTEESRAQNKDRIAELEGSIALSNLYLAAQDNLGLTEEYLDELESPKMSLEEGVAALRTDKDTAALQDPVMQAKLQNIDNTVGREVLNQSLKVDVLPELSASVMHADRELESLLQAKKPDASAIKAQEAKVVKAREKLSALEQTLGKLEFSINKKVQLIVVKNPPAGRLDQLAKGSHQEIEDTLKTSAERGNLNALEAKQIKSFRAVSSKALDTKIPAKYRYQMLSDAYQANKLSLGVRERQKIESALGVLHASASNNVAQNPPADRMDQLAGESQQEIGKAIDKSLSRRNLNALETRQLEDFLAVYNDTFDPNVSAQDRYDALSESYQENRLSLGIRERQKIESALGVLHAAAPDDSAEQESRLLTVLSESATVMDIKTYLDDFSDADAEDILTTKLDEAQGLITGGNRPLSEVRQLNTELTSLNKLMLQTNGQAQISPQHRAVLRDGVGQLTNILTNTEETLRRGDIPKDVRTQLQLNRDVLAQNIDQLSAEEVGALTATTPIADVQRAVESRITAMHYDAGKGRVEKYSQDLQPSLQRLVGELPAPAGTPTHPLATRLENAPSVDEFMSQLSADEMHTLFPHQDIAARNLQRAPLETAHITETAKEVFDDAALGQLLNLPANPVPPGVPSAPLAGPVYPNATTLNALANNPDEQQAYMKVLLAIKQTPVDSDGQPAPMYSRQVQADLDLLDDYAVNVFMHNALEDQAGTLDESRAAFHHFLGRASEADAQSFFTKARALNPERMADVIGQLNDTITPEIIHTSFGPYGMTPEQSGEFLRLLQHSAILDASGRPTTAVFENFEGCLLACNTAVAGLGIPGEAVAAFLDGAIRDGEGLKLNQLETLKLAITENESLDAKTRDESLQTLKVAITKQKQRLKGHYQRISNNAIKMEKRALKGQVDFKHYLQDTQGLLQGLKLDVIDELGMDESTYEANLDPNKSEMEQLLNLQSLLQKFDEKHVGDEFAQNNIKAARFAIESTILRVVHDGSLTISAEDKVKLSTLSDSLSEKLPAWIVGGPGQAQRSTTEGMKRLHKATENPALAMGYAAGLGNSTEQAAALATIGIVPKDAFNSIAGTHKFMQSARLNLNRLYQESDSRVATEATLNAMEDMTLPSGVSKKEQTDFWEGLEAYTSTAGSPEKLGYLLARMPGHLKPSFESFLNAKATHKKDIKKIEKASTAHLADVTKLQAAWRKNPETFLEDFQEDIKALEGGQNQDAALRKWTLMMSELAGGFPVDGEGFPMEPTAEYPGNPEYQAMFLNVVTQLGGLTDTGAPPRPDKPVAKLRNLVASMTQDIRTRQTFALPSMQEAGNVITLEVIEKASRPAIDPVALSQDLSRTSLAFRTLNQIYQAAPDVTKVEETASALAEFHFPDGVQPGSMEELTFWNNLNVVHGSIAASGSEPQLVQNMGYLYAKLPPHLKASFGRYLQNNENLKSIAPQIVGAGTEHTQLTASLTGRLSLDGAPRAAVDISDALREDLPFILGENPDPAILQKWGPVIDDLAQGYLSDDQASQAAFVELIYVLAARQPANPTVANPTQTDWGETLAFENIMVRALSNPTTQEAFVKALEDDAFASTQSHFIDPNQKYDSFKSVVLRKLLTDDGRPTDFDYDGNEVSIALSSNVVSLLSKSDSLTHEAWNLCCDKMDPDTDPTATLTTSTLYLAATYIGSSQEDAPKLYSGQFDPLLFDAAGQLRKATLDRLIVTAAEQGDMQAIEPILHYVMQQPGNEYSVSEILNDRLEFVQNSVGGPTPTMMQGDPNYTTNMTIIRETLNAMSSRPEALKATLNHMLADDVVDGGYLLAEVIGHPNFLENAGSQRTAQTVDILKSILDNATAHQLDVFKGMIDQSSGPYGKSPASKIVKATLGQYFLEHPHGENNAREFLTVIQSIGHVPENVQMDFLGNVEELAYFIEKMDGLMHTNPALVESLLNQLSGPSNFSNQMVGIPYTNPPLIGVADIDPGAFLKLTTLAQRLSIPLAPNVIAKGDDAVLALGTGQPNPLTSLPLSVTTPAAGPVGIDDEAQFMVDTMVKSKGRIELTRTQFERLSSNADVRESFIKAITTEIRQNRDIVTQPWFQKMMTESGRLDFKTAPLKELLNTAMASKDAPAAKALLRVLADRVPDTFSINRKQYLEVVNLILDTDSTVLDNTPRVKQKLVQGYLKRLQRSYSTKDWEANKDVTVMGGASDRWLSGSGPKTISERAESKKVSGAAVLKRAMKDDIPDTFRGMVESELADRSHLKGRARQAAISADIKAFRSVSRSLKKSSSPAEKQKFTTLFAAYLKENSQLVSEHRYEIRSMVGDIINGQAGKDNDDFISTLLTESGSGGNPNGDVLKLVVEATAASSSHQLQSSLERQFDTLLSGPPNPAMQTFITHYATKRAAYNKDVSWMYKKSVQHHDLPKDQDLSTVELNLEGGSRKLTAREIKGLRANGLATTTRRSTQKGHQVDRPGFTTLTAEDLTLQLTRMRQHRNDATTLTTANALQKSLTTEKLVDADGRVNVTALNDPQGPLTYHNFNDFMIDQFGTTISAQDTTELTKVLLENRLIDASGNMTSSADKLDSIAGRQLIDKVIREMEEAGVAGPHIQQFRTLFVSTDPTKTTLSSLRAEQVKKRETFKGLRTKQDFEQMRNVLHATDNQQQAELTDIAVVFPGQPVAKHIAIGKQLNTLFDKRAEGMSSLEAKYHLPKGILTKELVRQGYVQNGALFIPESSRLNFSQSPGLALLTPKEQYQLSIEIKSELHNVQSQRLDVLAAVASHDNGRLVAEPKDFQKERGDNPRFNSGSDGVGSSVVVDRSANGSSIDANYLLTFLDRQHDPVLEAQFLNQLADGEEDRSHVIGEWINRLDGTSRVSQMIMNPALSQGARETILHIFGERKSPATTGFDGQGAKTGTAVLVEDLYRNVGKTPSQTETQIIRDTFRTLFQQNIDGFITYYDSLPEFSDEAAPGRITQAYFDELGVNPRVLKHAEQRIIKAVRRELAPGLESSPEYTGESVLDDMVAEGEDPYALITGLIHAEHRYPDLVPKGTSKRYIEELKSEANSNGLSVTAYLYKKEYDSKGYVDSSSRYDAIPGLLEYTGADIDFSSEYQFSSLIFSPLPYAEKMGGILLDSQALTQTNPGYRNALGLDPSMRFEGNYTEQDMAYIHHTLFDTDGTLNQGNFDGFVQNIEYTTPGLNLTDADVAALEEMMYTLNNVHVMSHTSSKDEMDRAVLDQFTSQANITPYKREQFDRISARAGMRQNILEQVAKYYQTDDGRPVQLATLTGSDIDTYKYEAQAQTDRSSVVPGAALASDGFDTDSMTEAFGDRVVPLKELAVKTEYGIGGVSGAIRDTFDKFNQDIAIAHQFDGAESVEAQQIALGQLMNGLAELNEVSDASKPFLPQVKVAEEDEQETGPQKQAYKQSVKHKSKLYRPDFTQPLLEGEEDYNVWTETENDGMGIE